MWPKLSGPSFNIKRICVALPEGPDSLNRAHSHSCSRLFRSRMGLHSNLRHSNLCCVFTYSYWYHVITRGRPTIANECNSLQFSGNPLLRLLAQLTVMCTKSLGSDIINSHWVIPPSCSITHITHSPHFQRVRSFIPNEERRVLKSPFF